MTRSPKVIARIKGGIGNQLFCYAAARRLSVSNDAELVIDDVSGFVRDTQYRRSFSLHHFKIAGRKATPTERMEPFERYRRGVAKLLSRSRPFHHRPYVEQVGQDFEARLLALKVTATVYLDGYWQSEDYFKDIEATIREDLELIPPADAANQRLGNEIRNSNSVALHVRWFDAPGAEGLHNTALTYYQKAISMMDAMLASPRYFLFSDNPEAARAKLNLADRQVEFISHNHGDDNAYADLWLMKQCRHFITANSTFSWWGAWLGRHTEKVVMSPAMNLTQGTITTWNLPRQIPDGWILV